MDDRKSERFTVSIGNVMLQGAVEMTGCDEGELVTRAQERDNEAFAELMRRTSSSSLRLAMSILRNREEAEDEVQNSYVSAWKHVSQFQRESRFSTWISRIVTNQCLGRLRSIRRASFLYLDEPGAEHQRRALEVVDATSTPEANFGGREVSDVVRREIKRLPPLLRQVLILRDVEELSSAEAADRLSISISAVKSRLLRARIELRTRLEKYACRQTLRV